MSKPEDIPQDVWEVAFKALDGEYAFSDFYSSEHDQRIHVAVARAIQAAVAEEREAIAEYHDDLAAYHEACREESTGDAITHHTKMARSHLASASVIRARNQP